MTSKNFFEFIEKKYSIILLVIAFLFIILIGYFFWNLYLTVMLKKIETPKEESIDDSTLDKIIKEIDTREKKYLESTETKYRDIFK